MGANDCAHGGKFIITQPLKGEKDDYDSENSWISDGSTFWSFLAEKLPEH